MFGIGAWEAAVVVIVLFVGAILMCVYLMSRISGSRNALTSDLVRCSGCGRKVSREYASCPECGHLMPSANDASGQLTGRAAGPGTTGPGPVQTRKPA